MPLKTALRNPFFRPNVSSSPGGQVAKNNQSTAAAAIRMANDHNGWRSMNLFMNATRGPSGPAGAPDPEPGQPAGAQTRGTRTSGAPREPPRRRGRGGPGAGPAGARR